MSAHPVPTFRPAPRPLVALVALAALGAALAAGAGCSGDDRPFVEAVEVAESGLTGLTVAPPDRAVAPLVVAPGERVELTLAGAGTAGGLDVEAEDRDWTSSDPGTVAVDRDGGVTGVSPGTASIGVDIGGIAAQSLRVTVSEAPIAGIARLDGPDAPDPCTASGYVAYGAFAGEPDRLLTDTSWSLPAAAQAGGAAPLLRAGETDGEILLVPRAPGPVVLRARARGQTLDTTLTVPESLTELAFVAPPAVLRAGTGTDLRVTATYTGTDGTTRTEDVTDAVDFSIDASQAELGTVSSADGSRGRFEALGQGSVTVDASCGAYEALPVQVNVGSGGTGSGGSGSGLSFEDDRLTLSLLRDVGGRRVRVSTGGTFDDDRVTDSVEVVSSDPAVVTVSAPVDGSRGFLLFPRSVGSTTVRAFDDDEDTSTTLQVTVVEQ